MKPVRLLFLAFSLLLLAACNKKDEITPMPYDQAIIGKAGGFAGISKFFLINSSGVFPHTAIKASGGMDFDTVSLPAYKQAIARDLMNRLPSYLYSHPNTYYTCPNCADQSTLFIEVHHNGTVLKWELDLVDDYLPAELKGFAQEMSQSIDQL